MGSRGQSIRWVGAILLCVVVLAGAASAVPETATGASSGQNPSETLKQVQAILGQVWEIAAPWVRYAKSCGRDLFYVVYERASLQGVKTVAAEVGRIAFDFFSGRPYVAAYEVARDVPVVGKAVKEVIGEANLRKKAAQEKAAQHKEL